MRGPQRDATSSSSSTTPPLTTAAIESQPGRAATLAASKKTPGEIVEELYALVYVRRPTDEERAVCLKLFAQPGVTRRQAAEDIQWALINTPEFVFKN